MMSSNNVYRAFKNVTTYQEVKKEHLELVQDVS